MTHDTVVIGAGLAGLTAALRLAGEGQRVLVVARGVGSTHLAPATIDVLGFADEGVDSPVQALPRFADAHPGHPYARLPADLIAASIEWFKGRLPPWLPRWARGERPAPHGHRGGEALCGRAGDDGER